jgi:hypothetical protein
MPGYPVYDASDELSVDYDEFRQTLYCEKCCHETCVCPRYIPSQSGSILWMNDDMGMMIVALPYDTQPSEHVGQCYSAVDTDDRAEHVYQLVEYMSGPPHECMFQVKRVGDRLSLSSDNIKSRRRTPRLSHLRM